VDGKNFEKELSKYAPFEAQRQVAFADTVILNKVQFSSHL
jgi:G3E family GTPase